MKQFRKWCPDNAQTQSSDAKTKVDVVESDRKVFLVEAAGLVEDLQSHRQAGPGDSADSRVRTNWSP